MEEEVKKLLGEGAQLFKEGKLEEAIAKLKAAVEADPANIQAHSYLAAAYAGADQHPASVEQFQAAVDLDPQNAVHTFNLGQAFETSGNKPRATAMYEKALALDPKYARAQQRLDAMTGRPPAASEPPVPLGSAASSPAAAQTASIPSAPPAYGGPSPYGVQPQYGAPQSYDPSLGLGRRPANYFRYAGGWKRFAAAFIDGLIVNLVIGLIGLASFPAIPTVAPGAEPPPQFISALMSWMITMLCVWIVVRLLYFVGFNSRWGQTPGKMALSIRIVKCDGSRIGFGIALGRILLQDVFAQLTSGLAYLAIPINGQKRGWHDQIVGTIVVEG